MQTSTPQARPLVSILTPSFNQARWLTDNLRSVEDQTYSEVEHVVADGGSTDGTVEILRAAGERVRWVSESDHGQSDALNKAFSMSRGQIIGWINSDDGYFARTAIEEAVDFLERHPDVDLVYGHSAYVNADNLVLHMMWVPGFVRWWFRRQDYISQPTVFIRRSALGDSLVDGTFHFAMDYELWLRLLSQGRRFARIDRVLAFERVQPSRKTLQLFDVLEKDTAELNARYGIITGNRRNRVLLSALGIFSRFMGVRLLNEMAGDLAFAAVPATWTQLLRRQVAERRSKMPVGGDSA